MLQLRALLRLLRHLLGARPVTGEVAHSCRPGALCKRLGLQTGARARVQSAREDPATPAAPVQLDLRGEAEAAQGAVGDLDPGLPGTELQVPLLSRLRPVSDLPGKPRP